MVGCLTLVDDENKNEKYRRKREDENDADDDGYQSCIFLNHVNDLMKGSAPDSPGSGKRETRNKNQKSLFPLPSANYLLIV